MQQGTLNDVNNLGKKLSLVLGCALRLPARSGDVFVCSHGVVFQMLELRSSDDWSWAKEKHKKEVKQ